MTKTTTILLFVLLSLCGKSQDSIKCVCDTIHITTSSAKNIQPIDTFPVYSAFGFLDSSRTNTSIYRYRIGTGHMTGGKYYYREYNEITNTWSDTVRINVPGFTKDVRDVYGKRMDNDSTVVFVSQSENGLNGGSNWIDIKIGKCDSNNVFGCWVDFDWSVIPVVLERNWIFGNVVKGAVPGEYYAALIQKKLTAPGRSRISVIKTTDYWNHYYEAGVVYDGTINFSETALGNFLNGKFVAIMRDDLGGSLRGYESSNSCVTWTPRVASNLAWWYGGYPEIPNIFHERNGKLTIFYQCRDSKYMMLSRNNTVTENFGTVAYHPPLMIYQTPEMYAYNFGTGGNPSLGYGAMRQLTNGDYLLIYAYQKNNSVSWLMSARVNLDGIDSTAPEKPFQVDTTAVNATSFRIDINGYSQNQLDNIKYFMFDVSLDSTFSSFVTLKWAAPTSAIPAIQQKDIRMLARWEIWNNATTNTRYWIRVKACKDGCSDYKIVSIKTL